MCINSTVLWMIKSTVFRKKVKIYNLLMVTQLEVCVIVQLLYCITTRFGANIEEKERQKNKQKDATTAATTTALITTRKGLGKVLMLTSHSDPCASKADYTIGIHLKIKKYTLLMMIELELYEIVVQKQKSH